MDLFDEPLFLRPRRTVFDDLNDLVFDLVPRSQSLIPSLALANPTRLMRQMQEELRDVSPKITENGFEVSADVRGFKPEDLAVKVNGNTLTVEGNHEERSDGRGTTIQRQFVRQYQLPDGVELDKMKCDLSQDGRLKITAPCPLPPAIEKSNERKIPISFEGGSQPAKAIKQIEEEGKCNGKCKNCGCAAA
jgi:HSP20 family molecular chaperone IbpA